MAFLKPAYISFQTHDFDIHSPQLEHSFSHSPLFCTISFFLCYLSAPLSRFCAQASPFETIAPCFARCVIFQISIVLMKLEFSRVVGLVTMNFGFNYVWKFSTLVSKYILFALLLFDG